MPNVVQRRVALLSEDGKFADSMTPQAVLDAVEHVDQAVADIEGDLAEMLALTAADVLAADSARQGAETAQGLAEDARDAAQAVGTTNDEIVTALDANAASALRVQQDARLSSTYAPADRGMGIVADVDVTSAVAPVANGANPVAITTYVGAPNAIVHPSLLFFEDGWHGWRYWMAYTPFNNADNALENPSIAVSNDGDTWTVPAGLTNPVIPYPGSGYYNADPNLFMSPDGRMCMVWKASMGAAKETRLTTSRDGVTWSSSVLLFSDSFENVSPTVLYDNGVYRMWTVQHHTDPNVMFLRTATAPEGPWSAPVACTITGAPGVQPWHMDIKRVGQQYHCVMQMEWTGTWPNSLLFGKSNDGLAWEFANFPLIPPGITPQSAFYKPAILPKITPQGLAYDMWYSEMGGYTLHKTSISFISAAEYLKEERIGVMCAINGMYPYIFADSFNRTDTAAGLGTSTSGHTWSNVLGNNMGIVGNLGYLPAAANSRSVVELGVSDFEVGVTLRVVGTSCWMLFRYVDATNLWRVGQSAGVLKLQKIVAGTLTDRATIQGATLVDLDRITIVASGSNIEVRVNGKPLFRISDSANQTGTKVGINVDNTTARFDNMTARTL